MMTAREKLQSTRGESLVEVLAAIVVSGLALLMLATAITAAANMTRQAREALDEHYEANNALVAVSTADGDAKAGKVTISEEGSDAWSRSVDVRFAIAEDAGDEPLASYADSSASRGQGGDS